MPEFRPPVRDSVGVLERFILSEEFLLAFVVPWVISEPYMYSSAQDKKECADCGLHYAFFDTCPRCLVHQLGPEGWINAIYARGNAKILQQPRSALLPD